MTSNVGLRAALVAETHREIVAHLIPALRKWVDLYDTNPGTWPDEDHDLLSAAHIALNLYASIA